MAGPELRAAPDFAVIGRVEDLSGAGVVELIPQLPKLLAGRARLRAELDSGPDLAVFIDAPDLHLPLAARARKRGSRVPIVQLVVPQFWAWRPGRRQLLARDVQLSLCLFSFEVAPLLSIGAPARWVGHPLVDAIPQPVRTESHAGPLRIGLLPGSRKSEVHRNLAAVLDHIDGALGQTAREVTVPWRLDSPPPDLRGVTFTRASGGEVLAGSDLALVAFGTACLEATLLGIPFLAFGSAHPLTRRIVRPLLRTEWLALPNIVLKRPAVGEHVLPSGGQAFKADLRSLCSRLGPAQDDCLSLAGELREALGPGGFAQRAADSLEPWL
jgi:lipid-A-disaccharide synthase